MKRIGITAVLVASFAFSALTASSAFGAVEVGRCVAKAGGFYGTSVCSKKLKEATGAFEWEKGTKPHTIAAAEFTATSGTATLIAKGGTEITCETAEAKGRLDEDGSTHATKGVEDVTALFKKCKIVGLGNICRNKGLNEIETTQVKNGALFGLEGNLGDVNETGEFAGKKGEVAGQELHPAKKVAPENYFAIFECGGLGVEVVENTNTAECETGGGNCLISYLGSVNEMASEHQEVFAEKEKGVQNPQHFTNKKPPECNLTSIIKGLTKFERSTQNQELTVKMSEALEVKD